MVEVKERKISEKELIKHRIVWLSEYLLRWDLEDLGEDIKSLKEVSKGKFGISTSKRIRFT